MPISENAERVPAEVCVVGLGYIGLPTAAFIASKGVRVSGVDIDEALVDQVNRGEVPFFEPGFEEILSGVVERGVFQATTAPVPAKAYIIAVPTPFEADHKVDFSFIKSAVESIAPVLRPGALVILESTSPPGTTQRMAGFIQEKRPDLDLDPTSPNAIFVAHCPERVLPGKVMTEMSKNDRVIGGLNDVSAKKARKLYNIFSEGDLLLTDATTAEMVKLTENSFRDVNIAFANELSMICDQLDIDVWELVKLANHHPRVDILQPGPGVGGHCIAVDPWFIVSSAPAASRLIRTARAVNDSKPDFVINQVLERVGNLKNPTIAALGVSFKANIDDLRESPSLEIVAQLAQRLPRAVINVVEPHISELPRELEKLNGLRLLEARSAIRESDIVLLLVDHAAFKDISSQDLIGKTVIDTKGFWHGTDNEEIRTDSKRT